HRPFLFPVIGPSGRSLTRMGHPHDPETHSHHNSIWISHNNVNRTDFWSDRGGGQIRNKRIVEYNDSDESASLLAENEWVGKEGTVLLLETRRISVFPLPGTEWLMTIDMQLRAANGTVTLGKTPFGMIGVRMAKTIGVNDGGGTIRNSKSAVNEKEVLWKRARWVDYSGAITNESIEGITLFDHPDNPNFPTYFHVRNDGWMGASLTFDTPRKIEPDKPLHLRYGLYVHSDMESAKDIETRWKQFTQIRATKKD
ncbi:MAG: PmoA family protein, partial [Sedimentisphaerales bacterium]